MREDIIAYAIAATSLLLIMLVFMASVEAILEVPEHVQRAAITAYLH